jgi:hypothetical protein
VSTLQSDFKGESNQVMSYEELSHTCISCYEEEQRPQVFMETLISATVRRCLYILSRYQRHRQPYLVIARYAVTAGSIQMPYATLSRTRVMDANYTTPTACIHRRWVACEWRHYTRYCAWCYYHWCRIRD